jgi:hypothetical protein
VGSLELLTHTFFSYIIMDDLYNYIDIVGADSEGVDDDPVAYYLGYYD